MYLKDIILSAATMLGKSNLVSFMSGTLDEGSSEEAEGERELAIFETLANLTLSELASTYFPMVKTDQIPLGSERIYYIYLVYTPLRILRVTNAEKDDLFYKIHPDYIEVKQGAARYVTYEYTPPKYKSNSKIGYTEKEVPLTLLAFGLAAEVCLSEGRYDEAISWRERYSDGLNAFIKPKNRLIKGRLWA